MGRRSGLGIRGIGGRPLASLGATCPGGGLAWIGSTWTIAGNVAVNTPTLGAELLTNPSLEAPYVGGLALGWLLTGGGPPVLSEENVIVQHLLSSQKVIGVNAADGVYTLQAITGGTWFQGSGWLYCSAGSALLYFYSNGFATLHGGIIDAASGAWLEARVTGRLAGADVDPYCVQTIAAASTFYLDNVSVQYLTLSSLFCTVNTGSSSFTADVNVTMTAQTQAGLVLCLDSAAAPANFIIAYHDGTNAILEKCVAGVYTTLISAAAAYVAGAQVRVTKAGNNVDLYYNGVQIGLTQVVADAGVTGNTRHGLFSTSPLNTLASFNLIP